jgi:SanA protein
VKSLILKSAKNLAFLAFMILISGWLISTYMEVKAAPETFRAPDSIPAVDAIVVPGAGVYRSGRLSRALLQRMDAAVTMAKKRPGVKLVLSGHAIPKGYNETKAMRDNAIQHGFPARDVLIDERGRSTFLTLLNCKKDFHLRSLAVVSQGYHLPRSLYIARRLQLQGYGLAVESEGDGEWHGREWFSRLKDFFLVRVFPFFHAN